MRIKSWMNERFPVFNFFSGAFLYVFIKSYLMVSQNESAIRWEWFDFFGVLIPALFLFLLRIFDEHKDYESDKIHYPQRIIQRGIVSLKELKILGIISFVLISFSSALLWKGMGSGVGYLILAGWTFLMTKEFFAKEWLKKRLFLYSISHLVITPILLFFLMSLITSEWPPANELLGLALLTTGTGWLYELTRKCKGKEEETKDLGYSQIWGVRTATQLIMISAVSSVLVAFLLYSSLGIGWPWAQGYISTLALLQYCIHQYVKNPTAKNRKKNEGAVALFSLTVYLVPILQVVL